MSKRSCNSIYSTSNTNNGVKGFSNSPTSTPVKSSRLSIAERFAIKSVSPKKEGKGLKRVTKIWKIKELANDSTGTWKVIGTVVDGAYEASPFLSSSKLSQDNLDNETPYDTTGTLKSLPVYGKLFKALDQSTLSIVSENTHLNDLKRIAPYIVSETGDEPGSCKVWMYSLFQLIKAGKVAEDENNEGLYEDIVHNRIKIYFEKTRRKPVKKDAVGRILKNDYPDRAEAITAYDASVSWLYQEQEFLLDTDEKIDAFEKLATSF